MTSPLTEDVLDGAFHVPEFRWFDEEIAPRNPEPMFGLRSEVGWSPRGRVVAANPESVTVSWAPRRQRA